MKNCLLLLLVTFFLSVQCLFAQPNAVVQQHVAKSFPQWLQHFGIKSVAKFTTADSSYIVAEMEYPENWVGYTTLYDAFFYKAPKGPYFIDMFSVGRSVALENEKYVGYFEPDQALLLGKNSTKLSAEGEGNATFQLSYCGTACSFEEAAWLNENEVVIVGNQSIDGDLVQPMLIYFNVQNNLKIVYTLNITPKPITKLYSGKKLKWIGM